MLARAVRRGHDDLPGGAHLLARLARQLDRRALHRDRPDVVDGEVVARQGALLDHGASLSLRSGHTRWVADPARAVPEELELELPPPRRERALALLEGRDFRRLYTAIVASELGDALHYIALMWVALEAGGPLGVVAVRLADSVPALIFGLHGGLAADRWDRRRLMIAADLDRAPSCSSPWRSAASTGHLPIWGLVLAAFVLATATSYFAPAYGAAVPALVGRRNVQQANALVQATAQALLIGGWAVAAGLLACTADQRLLRGQRRHVLRLRRADRRHPSRSRRVPVTPRRRACGKASPRSDRGPRSPSASPCSASA